MNGSRRLLDEQVIESRFAARVSAALSARVEALPHDVSERLRFGRETALARARQARSAAAAATAAAPVVVADGGGAARLAGFVPWWQRAAAVIPVIALLAGLVAIDRLTVREQMRVAAEIDAQLLADDLPPDAYSDPGFAEFLRTAPSEP